jgi:hypothetical protein
VKAGLLIATAISVWTLQNASPIVPGFGRKPNADDRAKETILDRLPPEASVFADGSIFAHLGMDPEASVNMSGQKYLIFDLVDDSALWQSEQILIYQKKYRIAYEGHGLAILQRLR